MNNNWLEIKNLEAIPLSEIPRLDINSFREQLVKKIKSGERLVQLFGNKDNDDVVLYGITANDDNSKLYLASCIFDNKKEYESLTQDVPAAHLFEREFYEQFDIKPLNHPWLKPLRKINAELYNFFKMEGEDVHEVGVGPIHAGIIEPGHFRFSCHGEKIYHLEIQLGFQHRGIEKLFRKNNPVYLLKLAESVSGDSVIAHASTFVRAVESLSNCNVSYNANLIRAIALELERIAVHLGDLSALSNDVAYLTGSSVFGALRTKVINTTMSLCGNRFGRGLINYGGVNYEIDDALKSKILNTINSLEEEVNLASEVLFSSASVLERFEKTGIVDKETAIQIGMVGPAARASGVSIDVRADHPSGAYQYFPVHKLTLNSGDVFARAYIRYVEIIQSIKIIREQLENLSKENIISSLGSLEPNKFVISLTEGWRGEVSYVILTDETGKIKKVKIKDPSFNNWFALALAVRGNDISDFPLCNKSFNLSYCGFDL
ncbi:NADH-quinone oxidoreductase subunit C [Rosettibacter firmus]|uniref:hydrogenase large subunit n=1 Tax=Rosettibacter firmus TaxID=3111522 RepID=UPI00336BC6D2